MVKHIQSSFARGEIGPALYGRVDVPIYNLALRRAKNMFVHQFGGVSNRSGLKFLAPVKDHTVAPRLVEFQFKSTDTHILEFGNNYIRFMRNDAHITETAVNITAVTKASPPVVTTSGAHGYSNGDEIFIEGVKGMIELNGNRFTVANVASTTMQLLDHYSGANASSVGYTTYTTGGTTAKIYEIASTYTTAELPNLKFAQTADVLTIVHPDHAPATLTRSALASWALADIAFSPSIDDPVGITSTGGSGSATYYAVTAHSEDEEESLQGIGLTPAASTISAVTKASPGVVTTTGSHLLIDGDLIEITGVNGMTELNGRRFTVANKTSNTFELLGTDTTNYTTWTSVGTISPCFMSDTTDTNVTVSWTTQDDAVRYSIYKLSAGVFGWIGSSRGSSFLDTGLTPDVSITPPTFSEPFILTGSKPGAVTFHQQRAVMGGSNDKPDTTNYSVIGATSNFSKRVPATESDGFSTTLASREINEIRHYVSLGDLLIFTGGAEWVARSTSGDSRFSLSTISQEPQTTWGCSHVAPIVIGNKVLFVSDTGNQVRASGYSFTDDNYFADELSLMVPHLFRNKTVSDWAFVESPDPVIYMVMTDGTCNLLTFNDQQEVTAWSTMDTDGLFESAASIRPSITSIARQTFFVVKRTINGQTRRYIERTTSREFEEVEDCLFLDSSLSLDLPFNISAVTLASPGVITTTAAHGFVDGDEVLINGITWEPTEDIYGNFDQPSQLNGKRYKVDNAASTTFTLIDVDTDVAVNTSAFDAWKSGGEVRKTNLLFTGLHSLANETVSVLADGNVIKNLTVTGDGKLTTSRKYARVHIGLPYSSEIETLDPEISTRYVATAQGVKKHLSTITVRFERSRGMWVGPTTTDLVEMKQREFEAYGEPTSLLTGDKEITVTQRWNRNGRLVLRQRDPLPMSILAIVSDIKSPD
tara:strand:- start:10635 stop:13430 length:2796 start_codon:yes stop_codon:yes gene_type:complete